MVEQYFSRLLSLLNKNPLHPYCGCFDRNFWHYKMPSDFPSAIYQMGVFPLTLSYTNNIVSHFYNNEQIFTYIQQGIQFWASLQNKNGSFNEWYPYEQSVVATAFTTWGITESLLLLPQEKQKPLVDFLLKTFFNAGQFLEKNIDTLVSNHTAGSIAALYNLYLLTGDSYYLKPLSKNKTALLKNQDKEGWYPEYGEPDIGYQSVSIFFLSQYYKKSNDREIFVSLKKGVEFLSCFSHPDGTIGGEYASRNTKYIFRYGLYLLSSDFPLAQQILSQIDYNKLVNINSVDDRYFTFFFLPDFLLMLHKQISPPKIISQPSQFLTNAGIVIHETQYYKAIVNLKKGGALAIFDKQQKKLSFSHLGYGYKDKNYLCSTLSFSTQAHSYKQEGEKIILTVKTPFVKYEAANPLSYLFIPFRLFNLCFERFFFIHKLFNRYLKQHKIKKNPQAQGLLERQIILEDKSVFIKDTISNIGFLANQKLYKITRLSFRFVPSSNYSSLEENKEFLYEPLSVSSEPTINFSRKISFE